LVDYYIYFISQDLLKSEKEKFTSVNFLFPSHINYFHFDAKEFVLLNGFLKYGPLEYFVFPHGEMVIIVHQNIDECK
jgi:hypothetical protein